MRGGTGDYLDESRILKAPESGDEIGLIRIIGLPSLFEAFPVKHRERVHGLVPARSMNFLIRQIEQPFEVPLVTSAQERVIKHGAEGGREGERKAELEFIALPAFKQLEQGQVALGDGFVQPIFLEKLLVLRMADKRQVRVEHQREITSHQATFSAAGGFKAGSCGWAWTSPRKSVRRLNFNWATRWSSQLEVAVTSSS